MLKRLLACLAMLGAFMLTTAGASEAQVSTGEPQVTSSSEVGIQSALQCVNYVRNLGYPAGVYVKTACKWGDEGDLARCRSILVSRQVPSEHARIACNLASS